MLKPGPRPAITAAGLSSQLPDIDPEETAEWLESLDGILDEALGCCRLDQRGEILLRPRGLGFPSVAASGTLRAGALSPDTDALNSGRVETNGADVFWQEARDRGPPRARTGEASSSTSRGVMGRCDPHGTTSSGCRRLGFPRASGLGRGR